MSISKARAIESYAGRSRMRWIIPIVLLLIALLLALVAIREVGLSFSPKDESAEAITLEIEEGLDTDGIANLLEQEGLIDHARSFKFAVLLGRARGQLQAGTFEISAAQSPREIVDVLKQGFTKETKVTIPEGLKLSEVAEIMEEAGVVTAEEFTEAANQPYEYSFLRSLPVEASLEGFLFPDTYYFAADATATDVITKMLDNFEAQIEPLLDLFEKSDLSVYEVVTLASLVEGEVPDDADRKVVASVFFNRLAIDMPLRADSTLAYITGEDTIDFNLDDIAIDDPYNTYQIVGLPPGPINSPGLSSLTAVLEPAETNFFYFVSDPETGDTIFAETLEEHNQNIAKYLNL